MSGHWKEYLNGGRGKLEKENDEERLQWLRCSIGANLGNGDRGHRSK